MILLLTLLWLSAGNAWGQTEFYKETFGDNGSKNTAYAEYTKYSATEKMFTGSDIIASNYTGEGKVGKSSVNVSTGYSDASGKSAAWFTGTKNTTADLLCISNINAADYSDIELSFGLFYTNGDAGISENKITVYYQFDNGSEQELSFTQPSATAKWALCSGKLTGTGKSLKIRFNHEVTGGFTARIDDIVLTGTAQGSSTDQCAAPVFTPAGGTSFADNLTVTATTATEGAKVYYTTEAAPAECATEFPANGLTISATTTIRAIAKMEDGSLDASAEATATYTRIEALKGIKALRDRIKDDGITKQDDAKEYHVSLTDAVVTKASGKAASIEEGSTGVYYYSDNNTLKAGQRINGTVTVKGFLYGGWPEIISIGGGEITDGEAPEPAAATLAEIKSDYGKYESRYVKVAGAKVTKAFDRQNGEISQDGTDMALRAADNTIKMTVGKTVDVAGIVGIYNSTKQINVYGQSDITEKDVPVFAFTSDRATVEITDESPELPELTNTYEDKTVTYTSSDTDVADFDNGELLLLSAGTTTITAALASDESVTASYTLEVKKTKGTLAFEQDVYTVNIGETITLKATSNDTKATITYSAPKTEDGYVLDENTGDFIAGDNAMTVTVTAEAAGSDYYTAATATCTVKIVDPNAAADEYKKVNSSEEIVDGGVYLVICESEKTAMSKYGKKYMTVAENIEIANGVYVGEVNIEGKPYEMTINKSSEEGYYTLKTEEGFMKSGEKTELIVENSLEENNGAYLWTIDTDNEYSPIYNKELSERFFAYNPNGGTNPRFALYTNSTNAESRKPVYLYKKVSTTAMGVITIDGENSGYATFYSDKAYVMPEGVEGATVTAVNDEDGTLTVSYAYKAGSTVPAKTALLIKGEAGTHKVEYTESDESAPEGNMLHGADAVDAEGNTFVEGENVRYYILSHNTAGTDLGFYWAAENGAAVEYNAPYAFLAVDSKANVVMYSIEGGDGTTGITTVDGDNAKRNTGVYTISGMHIGDSTKNLPAGLYIVNGKKTVVGKTE